MKADTVPSHSDERQACAAAGKRSDAGGERGQLFRQCWWTDHRDRLFFFGGAEHVKRDLPAPVTVSADTLSQLGLPQSFGNAIPFRQNVTFFLGKLDWQISNANRLSIRYNGHRNDSPYNSSVIGGQYLIDRTFTFADRSHAGAVQLVSVLSTNAVNEARSRFLSGARHRIVSRRLAPLRRLRFPAWRTSGIRSIRATCSTR